MSGENQRKRKERWERERHYTFLADQMKYDRGRTF